MTVPGLSKSKDLDLCVYTLMIFKERLHMFDVNVVQVSPSLKTTGIESKINKLQDASGKMITMIEEMKEMVK
jgi:hypothetical protein